MEDTDKVNLKAAKKLAYYYSWHKDSLLELYNAISETKEKDVSKLHIEIKEGKIYFWVDELHTYFMKL